MSRQTFIGENEGQHRKITRLMKINPPSLISVQNISNVTVPLNQLKELTNVCWERFRGVSVAVIFQGFRGLLEETIP